MKLSYEDALYYKLLLQNGFNDEINNWIDNIAYNSLTLEGIYLDLVYNQNNINELISILHNYVCEKKINNKEVCDKLRLFIYEKVCLNKLTVKEAALSLEGFAIITEKMFEKYWNDFYVFGEYYYCVEERMIDSNKYYSLFMEFLKTGEKVDTDKLWNRTKKTFKDIILYEKKEMNPIRFKINYIVVPIFLAIFIVTLIIITTLLSINEEKYKTIGIMLFIFIGLMMLSLLISTPFIRKKEVEIELKKYDFTINTNLKEQYDIKSKDGTNFIFKKDSISINNVLYKYEDLYINIFTTNHLLKVYINIEIILNNQEREVAPYWNFTLTSDLLNAILNYNIEIDNKYILDYIIKNKEDAFKQILNYGYIRKIK